MHIYVAPPILWVGGDQTVAEIGAFLIFREGVSTNSPIDLLRLKCYCEQKYSIISKHFDVT